MSQENTSPRTLFHVSAIPFPLLITWIFALVFFMIFLLLDIVAIRLLARMSFLKNEGIVSHGEIVAWRYSRRRPHHRPWKPTIEFVDLSGQRHLFESSFGSGTRFGQSTSVIYARNNPENVVTCDAREYYVKVTPWAIAFSSFFVVVIGIGCVVSVKYLREEYERNLPKAERWRCRKRKLRDEPKPAKSEPQS